MDNPQIQTSSLDISSELNGNLVTSAQWDSQWAKSRPPRRLRPWRDYLSWRFAEVFKKYIRPGCRVLEVGCGGSRFLPYFAKDLGAEVWGLDYAPAGVLTARAALARVGLSGTIIQGDLFADNEIPTNYFDVVFSGGFIEHFPDTNDVVGRITRFAKPGSGVIITEVPNMGGWIGNLQKLADPPNYHQHVVITPENMDGAHQHAGAEPMQSTEYFGVFHLTVVSYRRLLCRLPNLAGKLMIRALEATQSLVTAPLWATHTAIESSKISPFVLGVYRRHTDR